MRDPTLVYEPNGLKGDGKRTASTPSRGGHYDEPHRLKADAGRRRGRGHVVQDRMSLKERPIRHIGSKAYHLPYLANAEPDTRERTTQKQSEGKTRGLGRKLRRRVKRHLCTVQQ